MGTYIPPSLEAMIDTITKVWALDDKQVKLAVESVCTSALAVAAAAEVPVEIQERMGEMNRLGLRRYR